LIEIKDAAGNLVKNYTGHLFEAIPCIDQTTGELLPKVLAQSIAQNK